MELLHERKMFHIEQRFAIAFYRLMHSLPENPLRFGRTALYALIVGKTAADHLISR